MTRLPVISVLLLASMFISCSSLTTGGKDPAGYPAVSFDYGHLDFSVLENRTIVIDPGHGGQFTGAVGPTGLTEKEVNLSVSTTLAGLLQSYGAKAVQTRTADVDLLAQGKSAVRGDLAARVDTAATYPDASLFISIHHNNLGHPNPKYNALETYYKLGDTGASLDLARYLHRNLLRATGLRKNYIRPGNYYVLRNNIHPAVLGEASYLSHPGTEKKLSGEDARRQEAYAYLVGIVEYLQGGIPLVENLAVSGNQPLHNPRPLFTARIVPGGDKSPSIDPQQIDVTLDGKFVPFEFDQASGSLKARPAEMLSNGAHRFKVFIRNAAGNAAREALLEFSVSVPPSSIALSSSLDIIPLDGRTPLQLTASIADELSRAVIDSTEVLFQFSDPNLKPVVARTVDGVAVVNVTPAANKTISVTASAGDISAGRDIMVGRPMTTILTVSAHSTDGSPVNDLKLNVENAGVYIGDRNGLVTVSGLESGPCQITISADGYIPQTLKVELSSERAMSLKPTLVPVFGGVCLGRNIAIDPSAGGTDAGATGTAGLRESDLNYRAAEFLAAYLRAAGAEVEFSRKFDENPDAWQRALRINDTGADIVVGLSHSSAATTVHHYPTSEKGKTLAGFVANQLSGLGVGGRANATIGYERLIQQVAAPAIAVNLPSPVSTSNEQWLEQASSVRKEAQEIFYGICRYYGWKGDNSSGIVSGRLSDGRGNVVAGAIVTLDGWHITQSDKEGRFIFELVDSTKPHQITIRSNSLNFGPYKTATGRILELLLNQK